jgi:hypothetical protein
MTGKPESFKDVYTRHVGGENYQYEAEYTTGKDVVWSARIFQDGDLKGTPSGAIADNRMNGEALRQHIIAYIESIIDKGLGIEE